jgi:hypothetical protein
VKLRVFFVSIAWAVCLYGQKKGFDFQEACFKNPSLPYCSMRDFAIKPPKGGEKSGPVYGGAPAEGQAPVTIDAAGIDWRFADPSADALGVLTWSKLPASSIAPNLADEMGSNLGMSPSAAQNVFRALSGVNQVAISVRVDTILILVKGRPADAILPALERGWKSVPLEDGSLLIGHSDAVDQATQRLSILGALGDFTRMAQQRPADSELWVAGSAKVAGQAAVSAGVKRFELTASTRERLISEAFFEFDGAAEPNAVREWVGTLGDAKIEGTTLRATMSMDADAVQRNLTQIAKSPLGQGLAAFLQSGRYVPVRDTAATVHAKPVIFGLDGGPKEVK